MKCNDVKLCNLISLPNFAVCGCLTRKFKSNVYTVVYRGMGIQGLLPLLDGIAHHVHISELSGKKVAIDVYCWLHKGVYSCSTELCQGIPTDKYTLNHNGI